MNEPSEEQDKWLALQRALESQVDLSGDEIGGKEIAGKRVRHSPRVKLMCVMEALKNEKRQVDIAKIYGVSPPLVSIWKKRALEGIVFALTNQTKIPMMPVASFGGDILEVEDVIRPEPTKFPERVSNGEGNVGSIHPEIIQWMKQIEGRLSKLAI